MKLSLSIIIPLYNMENTIKRTLDNLFEQITEHDDIEVICINDNSSDKTLEIISKYKNLKIVNLTERITTGACRNKGLDLATKEYIQFLDGDDLLNLNTVRDIISSMISDKDIQIGIGEFEIYDSESKCVIQDHKGVNFLLKSDKIIMKTSDLYSVLFQLTNAACWNKVFKREFLDENCLRFSDCTYAEDMSFMDKCLTVSNKLLIVKENMITYTSPETNPYSSDKNSINTWKDLFISLREVYSTVKCMRSILSYSDYYFLVSSFLISCIGHIRYASKKFNAVNNEFNRNSVDFVSEVELELSRVCRRNTNIEEVLKFK